MHTNNVAVIHVTIFREYSKLEQFNSKDHNNIINTTKIETSIIIKWDFSHNEMPIIFFTWNRISHKINVQYDGPVEVSSDDLSSSDSDASDDDPTAVDEPPLDDNDDCTEDEPEESFETGFSYDLIYYFIFFFIR